MKTAFFEILESLVLYISVSTAPTNLNIDEVQSRRFKIRFNRPDDVKGILAAYKIVIIEGGKCVQQIIVQDHCSTCLVKEIFKTVLLLRFILILMFSVNVQYLLLNKIICHPGDLLLSVYVCRRSSAVNLLTFLFLLWNL